MPQVRVLRWVLPVLSLMIFAERRPAVSAVAESSSPPSPPNVILILIDDLGATDLGYAGSRFYETPHIDRLATQGMRFTAGYSACTVCSPSRAALMTGKYPARLHITDWIKGHNRPKAKLRIPDWTMYLPLEETTIAERLRAAGYAAVHIGKWHLGDPPYYPQHQGFDVNLGGTFMGQPGSYFFPYGTGERRVPLDGGEEGEYLTDRLAEEAVRWIEAHRDRPFFMHFAHYAVHTPLQAKPELIERYQRKLDEAIARGDDLDGQQCPVYAAMIHSMDEAVGRLADALERLGLADRTVVVFTSDNGGLTLPGCKRTPVTRNIGLRAGKGSAYEGGVRVPLLVKWPGVTSPGGVTDTPAITNDLYPTILEMTGTPDAPDHIFDGESLVPILKNPAATRRSPLFWHYPHYHPGGATPYSAMRDGDWRLVEFFEDDRTELYHLRDDPEESRDLAALMPEKAKELKSKLEAWRAAVGAQLPTANPDYDPSAQP